MIGAVIVHNMPAGGLCASCRAPHGTERSQGRLVCVAVQIERIRSDHSVHRIDSELRIRTCLKQL